MEAGLDQRVTELTQRLDEVTRALRLAQETPPGGSATASNRPRKSMRERLLAAKDKELAFRGNPRELMGFLFGMDELFAFCSDGDDVPSEEDKVRITCLALHGDAKEWLRQAVAATGGAYPATYAVLEQGLLQHFIDPMAKARARDLIHELKQTGSALKYTTTFERLALQINDMGEVERYDKYVRGLKREMQLEVNRAKAATFLAAKQVVLRQDPVLFYYRGSLPQESPRVGGGGGGGATPMQLGGMGTSAGGAAQGKAGPRDYSEYTCYRCNKKGHISKHCPDKPAKKG